MLCFLTDYYNSGTCDYILKDGTSCHTLTIVRVISHVGGREMWDTIKKDILFQRQYRLKLQGVYVKSDEESIGRNTTWFSDCVGPHF